MIQYQDILKIYKGSGNPSNSFWFVGQEWSGKDDILINLLEHKPYITENELNHHFNKNCTQEIKSIFVIIELILRELGLLNLIETNRICIKSDGDIFWTNTLPLGFTRNKDKDELKDYSRYINGLENISNKEQLFQLYLEENRKRFQFLLNYKPRYIFVIGNNVNYDRFFQLIKKDVKTEPIFDLNVSFRSPNSNISKIKFFSIENLNFAICPFFSSICWTNKEEDIKKLVNKVKELINI